MGQGRGCGRLLRLGNYNLRCGLLVMIVHFVTGWMACGSCEKLLFFSLILTLYHSCTSGSLFFFARLDCSSNESLYILAVLATLLQKHRRRTAMPGFLRGIIMMTFPKPSQNIGCVNGRSQMHGLVKYRIASCFCRI